MYLTLNRFSINQPPYLGSGNTIGLTHDLPTVISRENKTLRFLHPKWSCYRKRGGKIRKNENTASFFIHLQIINGVHCDATLHLTFTVIVWSTLPILLVAVQMQSPPSFIEIFLILRVLLKFSSFLPSMDKLSQSLVHLMVGAGLRQQREDHSSGDCYLCA